MISFATLTALVFVDLGCMTQHCLLVAIGLIAWFASGINWEPDDHDLLHSLVEYESRGIRIIGFALSLGCLMGGWWLYSHAISSGFRSAAATCVALGWFGAIGSLVLQPVNIIGLVSAISICICASLHDSIWFRAVFATYALLYLGFNLS